MPSLSSGGVDPASLGFARAGLAVAVMARTIFPLFTNAFRRTAGNNRNNRNVNTATNLVFGHLALGLYVLPEAMTWFMGLFSRIMSTPSLPYPTAVLSLSMAPQYNEPSPVYYAYETFEHGYIAATQPPAPARPSSTMSEWPLTFREHYWSNFREAPLFSFASDPTPMNEVAVWVQDGVTPGQDFLGTVAYPLAAAAVLITMAILVGTMVDRVEINVRRCAKRASCFVWQSIRAMGTSAIYVGLLLNLQSNGHMSSEDCTEAILHEIITHPKFAILGETVGLWMAERLHRLEVSLLSIRAPPTSITARDRPDPSPAPSTKHDDLSLGEELAVCVVGFLWGLRTAFRGQRAVLNNKCHRVTARLVASLKRRLLRLPVGWTPEKILIALGVVVLAVVVVFTVPRWIWVSGVVYWSFSPVWNKLLRWGLNKVLDQLKQDPLLGPLVHRLLIVKVNDAQIPSNQMPPVSAPAPQEPTQPRTVPAAQEAIEGLDDRLKKLEARRSRKHTRQSAPVPSAPDPTAFHEPAASSLPPHRPDSRFRTPPHPLATLDQTSRRVGSASLPSRLDGGFSRGGNPSILSEPSSESRAARPQERVTLSYGVSASSLMASRNGTVERGVQVSPSLWSVPTLPSVLATAATTPPRAEVRSVAPSLATSPASSARSSRNGTLPRAEVRSGTPSLPGTPASSAASSRDATPPRTWIRSGAPSPSGSPASLAARMAASLSLATPPKVSERGVTPSFSSPTGSKFQVSSTTPLSTPPSKEVPVRLVGAEDIPCPVGEVEASVSAVDYTVVPSRSDFWDELWLLMSSDESPSVDLPTEAHNTPAPTIDVSQPEQPGPSAPATPPPAHLLNGKRVASNICSWLQRNIPSSVFGNQEEGRQYVYQATLTGSNTGADGPTTPTKKVGTIRFKRKRRERSLSPEESVFQWEVDANPDIYGTPLFSGPSSSSPCPSPYVPPTPCPPPKNKGVPMGELHLSRWAPGNRDKAEQEVLVVRFNKAMMNMIEEFENLTISSLEIIDIEMAETMDEVEGSQGIVQMELDFPHLDRA